MTEKEEFIKFVTETFDALKEQFVEKQKQYGTDDPMANFRTGAKLEYGYDNYMFMYEVAKQYENKHVSHIYNQPINGPKVDESLKDVAIYSIIELYMIKKYKKSEKN